MGKPIQITALKPEELAHLLTQAGRKAIAVDVVLAIAEAAGIVSEDGTINLIDYTAFLVREVSNGRN